GLVVEQAAGKDWEGFVQERIFNPLGMNLSNFSVALSQKAENFAIPHTEKEGQIVEIPFRDITTMGPAGSINSSVSDMVKWIEFQLSQGKGLLRKETFSEMHRVQTAANFPGFFGEKLNLFGYGLGWMVGLYKDHYTVAHGGGIDGFISEVFLLPKEKIGIVVLTNTDSRGVFPMSAACGIADCLMGEEEGDWLLEVEEKQKQFKKFLNPEKEIVAKKDASEIRSLDAYIGEFEHPGYGVIRITSDGKSLIATCHEIVHTLEHRCYDHFATKMKDSPFSYEFNSFFMSDVLGEISQLHIPLEPTLPPIIFKKKAQESLLSSFYLEQFEGDFAGELFSIHIGLKKGNLLATLEGQPPYQMHPEKPSFFSLKEVPGCYLRFVFSEEGVISELLLEQGGQSFSLKKRD
ncbi:MAG: serine hydrolase, partial [Chlamydiales bacterium]|nr:serine hydrolase [Chlamydiales bacterium]